MPFNFKLPTTAFVAFETFLTSDTHPSLPSTATATRGVLRNVLKSYKRLPDNSRSSHLNDVLIALNEYIPYLLAIDAGLAGQSVAGEDVNIILAKEVEVEWRPVLASSIPGREAPRFKLKSLEYEVLYTLSTYASVIYLLARAQLHTLYDSNTPSADQRTAAITAAMKHLLAAHSVYLYLSSRASQLTSPAPIPDVSASTFSALAALTLAEATLITVLKDDPYPAAVAQDRNKNDNEWMYKAPTITSVRASLFARLCIAASDHASRGLAMLGGMTAARGTARISDDLPRYFDDLRRTAKAKACRFLGIDAEMSGNTAKGIAYLRGASKELGLQLSSTSSSLDADKQRRSFGITKLKNSIASKREDARISSNSDSWGSDAGKFEEGRVVGMLLAKWERMNDVMNTQVVPASEGLLAVLPSGREYYGNLEAWRPGSMALEEEVLGRMRAPPSPRRGGMEGEEDSEDEGGERAVQMPGAYQSAGVGGSGYAGSDAYY